VNLVLNFECLVLSCGNACGEQFLLLSEKNEAGVEYISGHLYSCPTVEGFEHKVAETGSTLGSTMLTTGRSVLSYEF
jgi:hypothetical protein